MKRRGLLAGSVAGLGLAFAPAAPAAARPQRRPLDLATPADSLTALVKLRGDLAGGRVLQAYSGVLSLLVPGRIAAPVARYQGLIRTDWTPQPDGSYRYRTFDLGYFGELETGRPAATLPNPITGETLEPLDVRDGPVVSLYSVHGTFRDGAPPDPDRTLSLPWRRAGDHVWYGADLAFEYPNPLPSARFPDLSSTDRVTQRSTFTYKGRMSELEDAGRTRGSMETILLLHSTVHPWLRMGRTPALQNIHTISHKIDRVEDAPREVVDYMERAMPRFLADDTPFTGAGNSFERYRRERLGGV